MTEPQVTHFADDATLAPYPTIERLADLTQTTVGYQKSDLVQEAVLCWRELAAAKEWREAVLNELIVAHIYTKEHDTNPRKAIQDAITWHCQVALDPAVSSDARALIAQERERAEKAEAEVARLKDEREGNTRQFRRLQDRLAQSEADASSLAAGQCIVTNGGLMGDDHGHLYCDMQRQRDELRGRIRVMADIMSSALDVMKTVEGDGSEEDEALMNIRAKMASAIDYVARRDYPKESK